MSPTIVPETALRRAFPGCKVIRSEPLHGGISANTTLWTVELANAETLLAVVRNPTFASREELLEHTHREFETLRLVRSFGIAAPEPYYCDTEEPVLVLEYVPGAPAFELPCSGAKLERMAAELARIHGVSSSNEELSRLPRRWTKTENLLQNMPPSFDEALGESSIRARLSASWPWQRTNSEVLLHGDYWPGNLIWRGDELAAVIDWEGAQWGDPLSDVAIARLDVLWAFGVDAMHEFTARYAALTQIDWQSLAEWELCASLRPMSNLARWASAYVNPPVSRPDVNETSMRERHRWFVAQALERLRSS